MRFLLFTGYGLSDVPECLKSILRKSKFPENRTGEIIDYLDKNAVHLEASTSEDVYKLKGYLKKNPEKIAKLKLNYKKDLYAYYDKQLKDTNTFSVVDVDISIPWTIDEYDGAEGIQYLNLKIINKELNYCEFI